MRNVFSAALALTFTLTAGLVTVLPASAQNANQGAVEGPVGIDFGNGGAGVFTLPNFEGDTREEDAHYNTMHQFAFPAWTTYPQLLKSYAAAARGAASTGWPMPPYNTYDYAGSDMNGGPGGYVPCVSCGGGFTNGSSGIAVNGTNVSGAAAAGGDTGGNGAATSNVTGQLINPNITPPPAPPENNTTPGLVGN